MAGGFSTAWFAVAYLIAACAILAAVAGGFLLRRGGGLRPAFIILLAPWLLVIFNLRIVPIYLSFAFDPAGWGNFIFPVWVSPMVGLLLVLAAVVRAAKSWDERDSN